MGQLAVNIFLMMFPNNSNADGKEWLDSGWPGRIFLNIGYRVSEKNEG